MKNPFKRDKTLPAAPALPPLQRTSSTTDTLVTSHSNTSATTTTTQASGSGSENMMKPLKKRNPSIQSDPAAASPTMNRSRTTSTRSAPISPGYGTSTGLAYVSFCDSPFFWLSLIFIFVSCSFCPLWGVEGLIWSSFTMG